MREMNPDKPGWRMANAILWCVTLVVGFFSREAFDVIRGVARVNPFNAWVNNPWFLPIALSYVVGRFVRDRGVANGLNPLSALYEGIGFGLVSLVAFSALPVRLLAQPLPAGARILYVGYFLKSVSLVYIAVCLARYLGGDDKAFFRAQTRTQRAQDETKEEAGESR